jgi:hypothetical protein
MMSRQTFRLPVFLITLSLPVLVLIVREMQSQDAESSPVNEITYIVQHPASISLDPIDSDHSANLILMKHLAGTLVRFRSGGQHEPYLAERYRVSPDGHAVAFELRQGLRCEDEEEINAERFRLSLVRSLRSYARSGPVPIFSTLVGWDSFVRAGPAVDIHHLAQKLVGLRAKSAQTLELEFSSAVPPGLFEYLAMPYFGFFCSANFLPDEPEKWVSPHRIVSSGPYKVQFVSENGKSATLSLRPEWALNNLNKGGRPPETVHYRGEIEAEDWQRPHVVIATSDAPIEAVDRFTEVLGAPDVIHSVVLDTQAGRHFASIENRRAMQSALRAAEDESALVSRVSQSANFFYPLRARDEAEIRSGRLAAVARGKTKAIANQSQEVSLLAYRPHLKTPEVRRLVELTEKAAQRLGLSLRWTGPDLDSSLGAMAIASRTKFDLRITTVFSGTVPDPWVVDMMFCSDLGVSFPDPSGRVCALAQRNLRPQSPVDLLGLAKEVSMIVEEDASVHVLVRSRASWYFSKDIDTSSIKGDVIFPTFEELTVR